MVDCATSFFPPIISHVLALPHAEVANLVLRRAKERYEHEEEEHQKKEAEKKEKKSSSDGGSATKVKVKRSKSSRLLGGGGGGGGGGAGGDKKAAPARPTPEQLLRRFVHASDVEGSSYVLE